MPYGLLVRSKMYLVPASVAKLISAALAVTTAVPSALITRASVAAPQGLISVAVPPSWLLMPMHSMSPPSRSELTKKPPCASSAKRDQARVRRQRGEHADLVIATLRQALVRHEQVHTQVLENTVGIAGHTVRVALLPLQRELHAIQLCGERDPVGWLALGSAHLEERT